MFKCMLVATLIASVIFLVIDVIWLSFATKSFYRPLIGNLLTDTPVMWAAALFYILYVLPIVEHKKTYKIKNLSFKNNNLQ